MKVRRENVEGIFDHTWMQRADVYPAKFRDELGESFS
jgi:hypothetical protein